jgi:nucleoside-diphosphate-sugar epimerase
LERLDDALALTNRLRTEGLDHLLDAARATGAGRFVAQSFGLWHYEGAAGRLATEDDPFDSHPPATMVRTLAAVRHVESAVAGAAGLDGLALRYGFFYGPGTGIAEDGPLAAAVRAGRMPVIGRGTGTWSFVHVDDAAAATLAAIERGAAGVYNVVDDEPAAVEAWLPELANALGAEPPGRVSERSGRLAGGESAVYWHTRVGGLSNAKAKRELGWRPRYAGHRAGFRHGLADSPVAVDGDAAAAA